MAFPRADCRCSVKSGARRIGTRDQEFDTGNLDKGGGSSDDGSPRAMAADLRCVE